MSTESPPSDPVRTRARSRRWIQWIVVPVVGLCIITLIVPYAALLLVAFLIALGMVAASVGALVVLRRFLRDNTCAGSLLAVWRPSKREGISVALRVLGHWAPFGALSIVLWWGNGWIVDRVLSLMQEIIVDWCGSIDPQSTQLGWKGEWLLRFVFPDVLVDTLKAASSGVSIGKRALLFLPLIVTILIEIERWLSLGLLLWLTVRSLGYFLVRMVVAEQRPDTEVVFDQAPLCRQGAA